MLKYVELKSGYSDNGPAWIGRVMLSKSRQTIYFNGKALKRSSRGGVKGNHFDIETREEYWISGVKKDGADRHWAGRGKVFIEKSAVVEYLELTGANALDRKRLQVIPDLPPPDPKEFTQSENERL